MDLYNVDKRPLKKKDKDAYYYDDTGKFSPVPSMFDPRDVVFKFVMTCVKKTIPNISTALIEDVWRDAEDKKALIVDALGQIKREHESAADYYKASAYGKAIYQIQKLQVPLLSGAQAQKLKGVGKGIASHIDEILKAGRLKSVEERELSRIERQRIIESFTKIWGVNSKVAEKWYSEGFRHMTDVSEANLNEQQRIGIKYYEEFNLPIPREDVDDILESIISEIGFPNELGITHIDATGPYRRGASTVENVEIVISIEPDRMITKSLAQKIAAALKKSRTLTDIPVVGPKKILGVAFPKSNFHRKVNISLVPSDERGAVLIHSIGPPAFVVHVKEIASQQGYRLNEAGLFKLTTEDDEKIITEEESDIFDILGIPYTHPEDRF